MAAALDHWPRSHPRRQSGGMDFNESKILTILTSAHVTELSLPMSEQRGQRRRGNFERGLVLSTVGIPLCHVLSVCVLTGVGRELSV